MNYSEIIRDSVTIFWKHKTLWLFGIVLVLVGQGEYARFTVNDLGQYSFPGNEDGSFYNSLLVGIYTNPVPYLIGFGLLALLWWAIANFIGWLSQGALIGMVDEIDHTGTTSVRKGWDAGKRRVKRLFLLAVVFALAQLIIFLPAIVAGIWAFSETFELSRAILAGDLPPQAEMEEQLAPLLTAFYYGSGFLWWLICVGGIAVWALRLLNIIAARSCVLENLGVMDSIRRGWEVTRHNLGYILLNGIILLLAGSLFGAAAAIPALILAVPAFFTTAASPEYGSTVSIITGIITGFYWLIVAGVIGGTLTSFNSTLWTKLYKGFLAKERGLSTKTEQVVSATPP